MGLDDSDAQDAVQEALLRGWRARDSCRSPSPVGWLVAITRNEVHRLRARRRDVGSDVDLLELPDPAAAEAADHVCLRADLDRAAQDLSAGDRTMLTMHYGLGYTHSALANHLGLPEGTVKVRLFRARHKLRQRLATEGSDA